MPPQIRGRAAVPAPKRVDPTDTVLRGDESAPRWRDRPREDPRMLKRGWELSGIGAFFAFICWGIWAASQRAQLGSPLLSFMVALVVAVGVFFVSRLVGRVVLVNRLGRTRRSARAAHAASGLFLVAVGIGFLEKTTWVVQAYEWIVR